MADTSNGRCGSCQHWGTDAPQAEWGECVKAAEMFQPEEVTLAYVESRDGGGALKTNRAFGCVQWEAAE